MKLNEMDWSQEEWDFIWRQIQKDKIHVTNMKGEYLW